MVKKIPMRTCIACKAVKPKKELIRIVKNEQGVSLDLTGKKNGRGAYVCSDIECIKKLKKSKALQRAFECPVADETYAVIEEEFLGKQN